MEDSLKKNPLIDQLCKALYSINSPKEAKSFLRDLCTISELKSMSERLEVAKQVQAGTSYRQINKNTGVSTATITRVAYWLHHGEGGYLSLLGHLH
ncbi:MAG: TrpR-related protein YerC/YecD [Oceanicoccus sp.]|jgi:TrpR-related protein YerC/YecD